MNKTDKMTNKETFIRGGRLRKTSKGLVSFAPFLAGASALALGALLATVSPVEAGDCPAPTGGTTATSTCTGAADSTSDMTRTLAAPASGSLTVTDSDDGSFGLNVSSGRGLVVTSGATTTDISVDLDGDITSESHAIEIDHDGTGSLTVTTGENSVITSIGDGDAAKISNGMDERRGGHAIHLGTTSTTSKGVTITIDGDLGINTDVGRIYYHAINLRHLGTGDVNVTINGDVFGGHNTRVMNISTTTSAGAMTQTLNGNINTRGTRALGGTHGGSGLLDVTVGRGATITGQGNVLGNAGNGGTRITVDGTINIDHATRPAVYSRPTSSSVETEIDINNTVSGAVGVRMNNAGSAAMNLDISSSVTGTGGSAVELVSSSGSSGGHVVTLEQGGVLSGKIDASGSQTGVTITGVELNIDGTVTVTSGDAIELGGASDHSITVGSGGTVTGTIDASAATGAVSLDISGAVNAVGGATGNAIELGGAGNHTIILGTGASFTGKINGQSATGTIAIQVDGDVEDFQLTNTFLDGIGFKGHPVMDTQDPTSDSFTVNSGARLKLAEPTGGNTQLNWLPFTLSGRLELTGDSDNSNHIATLNATSEDAAIDVEVDFSAGDRTRDNERLQIGTATGVTEPIRVNIRAIGSGFPGFVENEEGELVLTSDTDGDGAITIGNFITAFSLSDLGERTFITGGVLDDGDWDFQLVYEQGDTEVDNQWNIVAVPGRRPDRPDGPGGPGGGTVAAGPATLFDTLPAVLAHLGQPESMHRRTQNRSFRQGTGVWGRIQTGNISVETTAAPFEIDTHDVTFGVQAPVIGRGGSQSVALDANITLKTAETEARVADGKQDIQTNAVIAGVGATWKHGGLYADGQFQYARFDNDMDTADDTRLASPTADSFTAGVEVGYTFDGGDVKLGEWLGEGALTNIFVTPSAQVSWSQVDFSDFVATDGKAVSLDDGSVINGRVGAVIETNWENVVFYEAFAPAVVRLQGSADVIFPLDGVVVTQVDGADQPSEREDPTLDLGVGASYTWEKANNAYTISADVSSLQGSEVDGYEANVGFKYQF